MLWHRIGVAAALMLAATSALGWGVQGHRISGYIANSLLRADTRAQLLALVGTDDLSQIAGWMDEERDALEERFPESSRWHYENRAVCGSPSPSCDRGACVTAQIQRHLALLRNPAVSMQERADAVRILTHLLGDLHQPLHLADNRDRGGNEVSAQVPTERNPRKLHEIWDTTVVKSAVGRRNAASYSRALAARFADRRAQWETGSVDTWAEESYTIGKQMAYESLPTFVCARGDRITPYTVLLTERYLSDASAIAEEQLAKAGIRIAYLLNSAL